MEDFPKLAKAADLVNDQWNRCLRGGRGGG
jgi:hypothetical protein